MSFARRCSGQRVMFCPASVNEPRSGRNVPATALSRVDLPEPLVPMIIRNEPRSNRRDTSRRARTSLGVPGLKVLVRRAISSMSGGGRVRVSGRFELTQERWGDERDENKAGGNQLEVV